MIDWLLSLPDSTPKFAAIAIFVGVLVVSFVMPRDFARPPGLGILRDLRLWALLLLVLQLLLYSVF